MKKVLLAFILIIALFLTACGSGTSDDGGDKNPTDQKDPSDSNDPSDPSDPSSNEIDPEFVLSMDTEIEGNFSGETVYYYFSLPQEIAISFYLEADFSSKVIIRNTSTNHIEYEGSDIGLGGIVYEMLTLSAGDYIVEVNSTSSETGSFNIVLSENTGYTPLVIDQLLDATMDLDGAQAYLLTITKDGDYSISSKGNLDLIASLVTMEGEFLGYNDNRSVTDKNFEIIAHLEVGTYVIGVSGTDSSVTGSYQILVEETSGVHTTYIEPNTSVDDFVTKGEQNTVEFEVPMLGDVQLYVESSYDTYGAIYDVYGNLVGEDSSHGTNSNFYIDVYLESGTYFLIVSVAGDFETAEYELYYDFPSLEIEYTPVDINSFAIGQSVGYDTMYFELIVTEAVVVDIYSTGEYNLFADIYTSLTSNTSIAYDYDSGEDDNFLFDDMELQPGSYYIQVGTFDSPVTYFELHVDLVGEGSTSSSGDQTAPVEVNTVTEGTLASGATHTFMFYISADGTLTTYLESDFDSIGYIKDIYGNTLIFNEGSNDFKIEDYEMVEGLYSIVIIGAYESDYGDYTLHLEFDDGHSGEVTEGVADAIIYPNEYYYGDLASGAYDTVSFTLERGGYIHAYIDSGFDTTGYLYGDYDPFLYQYIDDANSEFNDLNFIIKSGYLEAGIYHIDVAAYNGVDSGVYDLELDVIYGNIEEAVSVSFGSVTETNLEMGDYDWYKIEVLEAGYIDAYTISEIDTYGFLLDEFGYYITYNDDGDDADFDFQISTYLEAGTYYVVALGFDNSIQGDYDFHVEYTPTSD